MGIFDWIKKNKNNDEIQEEALAEAVKENTTEETDTEEQKSETVIKEQEFETATEEPEFETAAEEPELNNVPIEEPVKEEPEIKEPDEEPEIEEPDEEETKVENIDNTDIMEQKSDNKKGLFAKIKSGLTKTRDNIVNSVDNVLKAFVKVDEDLFEELEEALIMADIGVETSVYIIEKLREKVKDNRITDAADVKAELVDVINEILIKDESPLEISSPTVILVIGVNGVGKTTTIGKLTHIFKEQGKSVLIAAADTFRAAAIDQLEVWADRNNVGIIKHQENSDPGAVVFDAVQAAKARKADILICDTAGRLHNKKNLMEELKKISRIIAKEYDEANTEVFLVLDATTGQNAVVQAKLFKEAADITGIVLTKLDGTAKGGIVLAIKNEMNIPVRYIGVGEGLDDLQPFNSAEFAKALFDNE